VFALRNYRAANGAYPPLYTQGKDGRKLHSWRVLLVPYINDFEVAPCNLSEPWDSRQNLKWAESLPVYVRENYKSPAQSDYSDVFTSFVAIDPSNGKNNDQRLALDDDDCGSAMIALVEMHNSGIHWMEPRDLTLEDAKGLLQPRGRAIRIVTRGGLVGTLSASALTCDGSEADSIHRWLIGPQATRTNEP
jgi:hypothetical protein